MNGETNNMWNILNVLQGRSLYMNPEQAPYEIFQYSPLSQMIYIGVAKITSSTDYLFLYKILRTVSLLWNIVAAVFIYKIANKSVKLSKYVSFTLAFLSLLILTPQNWVIRPDAFAVTASFIAISFAFLSLLKQERKYIYYSAVFTSVSLLAKQDAIQLFVIIPTAFALIKEYTNALLYLISSVFSSIVFLAFFYWLYGEVFFTSIIGGVDNGMSLLNAFSVFNRYLQIYNFFPFLILGVAFYFIVKSYSKEKLFLSFVVIGTFLFGCAVSLKPGAWINYFTLPGLVSILLFTCLSNNILNSKTYKILYLLFGFYFFSGIVFHYSSNAFQYSKKNYEEAKNISLEIRNQISDDTYIFTDNRDLKLHLFDKTIFPNTEYYGVSPFEFKNTDSLKIVFAVSNSKDYYICNFKADKNELKEIKDFNAIKLYSYDRKK